MTAYLYEKVDHNQDSSKPEQRGYACETNPETLSGHANK